MQFVKYGVASLSSRVIISRDWNRLYEYVTLRCPRCKCESTTIHNTCCRSSKYESSAVHGTCPRVRKCRPTIIHGMCHHERKRESTIMNKLGVVYVNMNQLLWFRLGRPTTKSLGLLHSSLWSGLNSWTFFLTSRFQSPRHLSFDASRYKITC
jgi:hypothetical protein